MSLLEKIKQFFIRWLLKEPESMASTLCDFDRLSYEIRPCDVLLIEGLSRVSEVINAITQSPWTHAALYIGRLHDIPNPILRDRVKQFYSGPPEEQLMVESVLGSGTIISPLSIYRGHHIRICRPKGIRREDSEHVIGFAVGRLGTAYGIRQNLDLARFLFPYSILPRRFRSSLFEHNPGAPTHEICSSMLAEAFGSVNFPILPIIKTEQNQITLYHRNPKLYTPSDFDYSPYFEIIKYPIFELSPTGTYRNLPWDAEGKILNDPRES